MHVAAVTLLACCLLAVAEDPVKRPEDLLKDKLSQIVDEEMDTDKDGSVTVGELQAWLQAAQVSAVEENVDRQWRYYEPELHDVLSWEGYNPEKKEVLHWDKYKNLTFPDSVHVVQTMIIMLIQLIMFSLSCPLTYLCCTVLNQEPPTEESTSLRDILVKTERRWKTADSNEDGYLEKEEFKLVLHPEESDKMSDVLVLETIEDMDSDKNGEVSLDEYMAHLSKVAGPERDDPAWAQAQQSNFASYLDKNKDGSLSREEMKEWVVPPYDRYEADAWRLMSVADKDNDAKLSKQDIMDHHEYFVSPSWAREEQSEGIKHDEF
ncbi:CALU [Cordylochernes scorpioides]|uniref:CALU n=1 Tax=Cordylochernes scorpioides TaxID=51811 RepID=A0ABY6LJ60_9ARAC|nr:CALU [Cordylochernes scorpioides]